jgi:hypothetical protein
VVLVVFSLSVSFVAPVLPLGGGKWTAFLLCAIPSLCSFSIGFWLLFLPLLVSTCGAGGWPSKRGDGGWRTFFFNTAGAGSRFFYPLCCPV